MESMPDEDGPSWCWSSSSNIRGHHLKSSSSPSQSTMDQTTQRMAVKKRNEAKIDDLCRVNVHVQDQQQTQQQHRPFSATFTPKHPASKLEQQQSVRNNGDEEMPSPLKVQQAKRSFPSSEEKENLVGKVGRDCAHPKSVLAKTTTTTTAMTQAEQAFKRHKSSSASSVKAVASVGSNEDNRVDEQDDDHWDEYYYQLAFFKATEGHTYVPIGYVCKDDYCGKKDMEFSLGKWVHRHHAELSPYLQVANEQYEQASEHIKLRIRKLQDIGFEFDDGWGDYYVRLVFFKAMQGHTNVPIDYVCNEDQLPLGKWVAKQRNLLAGRKKEHLHTYIQLRRAKLQDIGFVVNQSLDDQHQQADSHKERQQKSPPSNQTRLDWKGHYKLLQAYKAKHQHLRIPVKYVTPDGFALGKFAGNQRASYCRKLRGIVDSRRCNITQKRIDLLDELNFPWQLRRGQTKSQIV